MTRFFTGKIAPSPTAYEYWVDLNENPYGGVIKYYNGSEWVYINENLVEQDKELQQTINDIQNQLKNKADKSTTLSGYGITDAYTKSQTDTKVSEAISNVVGAAPDALDTLYEIAEALNNDEDFAASITTQLGNKLDKSTYNTDKATFATKTELNNKVDKVSGKQLSTNDFTNKYKTQLDELVDQIMIPEGGTAGQVLKKTANGVAWQNDAGLQDAPSDGKTYGRKDGQWAEVQSTVTKEDLEDLLSYGVEWDTTVSDPDLTRIGNPLLHKSLPVQSQLKGCVAVGSAIKYYLNPNDWSKKEDGTNAVLDGTDGSVRVHVPKFYGKSEIDGNKRRVRISTTQIDSSYTEIPEMLIDAYRATVDTTAGSTDTTAKMLSVVNTTTQFRGGNNSSTYDQYLGTDDFRTMLGKPRTNISRATARKYARNADSELLNYEYYKWVLYWLPVIEYATFNLQQSFNSQLTSDGYHQGGLGDGLSTMDGNCWGKIFGNNPITPCGYANNLGNFTGTKDITLPNYTFTPILDTTMQNWANVSNGTGTKDETLNITNVATANANLTNISYDRASGQITYHVTGVTEAQSIIFYTNNTTVATATQDGDIVVNWGNSVSTRYIRANFTGDCNITISYVSGTSTNITWSSKTLTIARYRGFENIFGDIWTNLDGIIINSSSELHPNDTEADVYTTTNPDNYGDDEAALSKMKYTGREADTESYIKEFDLGTKAEIIPIEVGDGAGPVTYKCDFHYRNTSKDFLRALVVGGDAHSGAINGVGAFHSNYSVGNAASLVGFRTYSLI